MNLKIEEARLYFTKDEVNSIFSMIDKDIKAYESGKGQRDNVINFRKRFRLFVEFLLNTGLRRGEALKLRKENIDLHSSVIYIEKTKTSILRAVPLNQRAKEILGQLGDDLFAELNEHDVTNKFTYYVKEAGLSGFTLHSLRHTFATRLVSHGVDIYTISRLLGHTDIKTTMIYAKVNIDSMKSAVDKL